MMKKYTRYGITDIVISEEEMERLGKDWDNVSIVDKNGEHFASLEFYFVADEDEDGNELDEDESEVE